MDKVQQVAPKDYMTSFGDIALASATDAANILNLNKADASRMSVVFQVTTAAAGGTSLVFKVQGCDTENGTYTDLAVSPSVLLADLTVGKVVSVPIPAGYNKKYLKAVVAKTGTFTAGVVSAQIDSYLGI